MLTSTFHTNYNIMPSYSYYHWQYSSLRNKMHNNACTRFYNMASGRISSRTRDFIAHPDFHYISLIRKNILVRKRIRRDIPNNIPWFAFATLATAVSTLERRNTFLSALINEICESHSRFGENGAYNNRLHTISRFGSNLFIACVTVVQLFIYVLRVDASVDNGLTGILLNEMINFKRSIISRLSANINATGTVFSDD